MCATVLRAMHKVVLGPVRRAMPKRKDSAARHAFGCRDRDRSALGNAYERVRKHMETAPVCNCQQGRPHDRHDLVKQPSSQSDRGFRPREGLGHFQDGQETGTGHAVVLSPARYTNAFATILKRFGTVTYRRSTDKAPLNWYTGYALRVSVTLVLSELHKTGLTHVSGGSCALVSSIHWALPRVGNCLSSSS
jgi:hypothetical protein